MQNNDEAGTTSFYWFKAGTTLIYRFYNISESFLRRKREKNIKQKDHTKSNKLKLACLAVPY